MSLLPGIPFDFGAGRVLVVPPLSLTALEKFNAQLSALPELAATDPKAIGTILELAHQTLRRNYPEMSRDEVGDLIDLGNMAELYACLMDVGGLRRRHLASSGVPDQGQQASPPAARVRRKPGAVKSSEVRHGQ